MTRRITEHKKARALIQKWFLEVRKEKVKVRLLNATSLRKSRGGYLYEAPEEWTPKNIYVRLCAIKKTDNETHWLGAIDIELGSSIATDKIVAVTLWDKRAKKNKVNFLTGRFAAPVHWRDF